MTIAMAVTLCLLTPTVFSYPGQECATDADCIPVYRMAQSCVNGVCRAVYPGANLNYRG